MNAPTAPTPPYASASTAGPDQDAVDAFVGACHFDLATVESTLDARPELLERRSRIDELPIEAASHVGNRAIIEALMARGAHAPLWTHAALGDEAAVAAGLEVDPTAIDATGAHGISLLSHAVVGGNEALCRMLIERGARLSTVADGASQDPLHAAVLRDARAIARLLVAHGAPIDAPNYQGKSPRELAVERGLTEMIAVLDGDPG